MLKITVLYLNIRTYFHKLPYTCHATITVHNLSANVLILLPHVTLSNLSNLYVLCSGPEVQKAAKLIIHQS